MNQYNNRCFYLEKLFERKMEANVYVYKEYAEKHLPNFPTLEDYWASDFELSAYPDAPDYLAGLEQYLTELSKYTKHLVKAAYLRHEHFLTFIDGHYDEDQGHRVFRVGLNKIAEDACEKLAYWTNIRDELLDKHIRAFEQKEARIRLRLNDVDMSCNNVDYIVEPKKQMYKRSSPPRISDAERRLRRFERYQQRICAEHIFNELVEPLIARNEEIDKSVKNTTNIHLVDVNIFGQEVLAMSKRHDELGPIVPCLRGMYEKHIHAGTCLLKHNCASCKPIGLFYANFILRFKEENYDRITELGVMSVSKCFQHHFMESLIKFSVAMRLSDDDINDILDDQSRMIDAFLQNICRSDITRICDTMLTKIANEKPEIFDAYVETADAYKDFLRIMWSNSVLLRRISQLEDLIIIFKSNINDAKDVARRMWNSIQVNNPEILTTTVYDCCTKERLDTSDIYRTLHLRLLKKVKKTFGKK